MHHVAPGRRRRIHSAVFKAQAVQTAQQPGLSMAAVAMAHGINAKLLRPWVHERMRPPADTTAVSVNPVGFVALSWLAAASDAFAAWMRKLLR